MSDSKQVKKHGGEGDREAARRYEEKTKDFVKKGKVDEAAKKAGDQNPEEAREAEKKGKAKAKELDPEVHRDYDKPTDKS